MQEAVRRTERAGWVTRTYPAVLDTWRDLSPVARVAAMLIYSECQPGEVVEIIHARFYDRLPCADETSSRDAFRRLEQAGVLRCVFRRRGQQGRAMYRLGDPIAAYHRRGLGVREADPQLLLPFALDDVIDQIDMGGGVLRLVTAVDIESGRIPGLMADGGNSIRENSRIEPNGGVQSGRIPGFNPGEFPDSADRTCHESGDENSLPENSSGVTTTASTRDDLQATGCAEGNAGHDARRSQLSTSKGIESARAPAETNGDPAIDADEGATIDGSAAGDCGLGEPASPTSPDRRAEEFGTGVASRGARPMPYTYEKNSLNSSYDPYALIPSLCPSAAARASDDPACDARTLAISDALIDGHCQLDEDLWRDLRGRLVRAIEEAERRLGIDKDSSRHMGGDWVCCEWADLAIDVYGEDARAAIDRLVAAIQEKTAEHLLAQRAGRLDKQAAFRNPGGYVYARLKSAYRKATGKPWAKEKARAK